MITILLFSILLVWGNLRFLKWAKADQIKHRAALAGTGTVSHGWIETPSVKAIVFGLGLLTAQYNCLQPIYAALNTSRPIERVLEKIQQTFQRNESTANGNINSAISVENGDLTIRTYIIDDPDIQIEITGFDTSEYVINKNSMAHKQLIAFFSEVRDHLLPIIDSNSNLIVNITGQADAIPTKKKRVYRGSSEITCIGYESIKTKNKIYKGYTPGITILENEDYGRLRAYEVYKLMQQNIPYPNSYFSLFSNVSKQIGYSQRKVEIKILVPDAFKSRYSNLSNFQKKIFEFTLNHTL